jgi:hypothetical protein
MFYELADAQEQLNEIVDRFTPDAETNESDFQVWFAHLYGHLNTAWNMRHCSAQDHDSADGKQLDKWKQFPTDMITFEWNNNLLHFNSWSPMTNGKW